MSLDDRLRDTLRARATIAEHAFDPEPELLGAKRRGRQRRHRRATAGGMAAILGVVLATTMIWRAPGAGDQGLSTLATGPVSSGVAQPPDSGAVKPMFPRCRELASPTAPPGRYRSTPAYVGNEMPTQEVKAWAAARPGYVEIWTDRDHNGWITVAFTGEADLRQAELDAAFPGVGVVAVAVDWTHDELTDLQRRVAEALAPRGWRISTGAYIHLGVASVDLGVLSRERLDALASFRGERLCVEGADAAEEVKDGPQSSGGDGWRLLGDGLVGQAYRTGVATTAAQYAALWSASGLRTDAPAVDFDAEIVVWFGAVYGSSCPVRFDGVDVDEGRHLLFARIVVPGNVSACAGDANPHAYVVSVRRDALPRGPFAVQLVRTDPPVGAPEERTLVSADLSARGSVATGAQIGPDPALVGAKDRRNVVGAGATISVGDPWLYKFPARCGAQVLGVVNGVLWETDELGVSDPLPPQWQATVDQHGDAVVDITLTYVGPTLAATTNGRTLTYRPSDRDRNDICR